MPVKPILAIGVVVLAGVGYMALNATRNTSRPLAVAESQPAAHSDALVDIVLPATLSANAQVGQRVFEAACASCHGQNAVGRDGFAPPLVHRIYEPSHHGDAAFLRAVQNGVAPHHWRFGAMPPIDGLTGGDVAKVVAYVRALQQANGIR